MWKVHSYGTTTSNCKASQKITKQWFQDLFGDDLSGGAIKIRALRLISKLIPLKTIVGIPIIISYTIKLQRSKLEHESSPLT